MQKVARWKTFRVPQGGWRFMLLAGKTPVVYSANSYPSRKECEAAIEGMKSTKGQ